jgi:hypothetical protein
MKNRYNYVNVVYKIHKKKVLDMIDYLKFKNFNNIELTELTENTIIIFKTRETLFEFRKEFEKLIDNKHYKDIEMNDSNSNNIKIEVICRNVTAIYDINAEQRIILTVEPISILLMRDLNDLWFVDKTNENWDCWDFIRYEHFNKYNTTLDIYRFICISEYGCGSSCKTI